MRCVFIYQHRDVWPISIQCRVLKVSRGGYYQWLQREPLLGGSAAYAGGAPVTKAALRVTFWGALAMAPPAAVGALFGAVV